MAVLSEGDRQLVFTTLNRANDVIQSISITKAQLRAALDAVDDWVDTNASAFNTAIPQPARGSLTARQKAALLMYVVQQRFSVS